MRIISGLWAWRRNPLCRRTDRTEGWLSLCAAVLIAVGAPLIGLAGGLTAHAELRHIAGEQHRHRHPVWATTQHLQPAERTGTESEDPADSEVFPVIAFWNGPDGVTHTGPADAGRPVRPGDRFRVWTDRHGRITPPPMSAQTAASHSVVAGMGVAVAAGVAMEAARRTAVRQLLRRRYARWDAEWARIGPDWGRTGSNS